MQTRHEDHPKDVADHGVRQSLEPAAPHPLQPIAAVQLPGTEENSPRESKRPGFLLVLLRALSAWSV